MEQLRCRLDIYRLGGKTDRNVALDGYTHRMGVGNGLLQLAIGVVLQVGVVGGVLAVTTGTIERVTVEPIGIVGKEALVVG